METENATGITPELLKEKLESQLEATHVEIQDMSGKNFLWDSSDLKRLMVCCRRLRSNV